MDISNIESIIKLDAAKSDRPFAVAPRHQLNIPLQIVPVACFSIPVFPELKFENDLIGFFLFFCQENVSLFILLGWDGKCCEGSDWFIKENNAKRLFWDWGQGSTK